MIEYASLDEMKVGVGREEDSRDATAAEVGFKDNPMLWSRPPPSA